MYKRILVTVDGSEISNHALREALTLAKDQQSDVRIIHVVYSVTPSTGEVSIDSVAYRQSSVTGGQQVLDRAKALARQVGVDAETALVEAQSYHPSFTIVEEAKRWSADVIVMGTHGRSGLIYQLLGSVAEGVVRNTPVPVLLVRGA